MLHEIFDIDFVISINIDLRKQMIRIVSSERFAQVAQKVHQVDARDQPVSIHVEHVEISQHLLLVTGTGHRRVLAHQSVERREINLATPVRIVRIDECTDHCLGQVATQPAQHGTEIVSLDETSVIETGEKEQKRKKKKQSRRKRRKNEKKRNENNRNKNK